MFVVWSFGEVLLTWCFCGFVLLFYCLRVWFCAFVVCFLSGVLSLFDVWVFWVLIVWLVAWFGVFLRLVHSLVGVLLLVDGFVGLILLLFYCLCVCCDCLFICWLE